jgi:hypothetical protein
MICEYKKINAMAMDFSISLVLLNFCLTTCEGISQASRQMQFFYSYIYLMQQIDNLTA